MEDPDDNISSTGFESLFIKEDELDPNRNLVEQRESNTAPSGLTFAGTLLNQSALMKPYLQEMDNLLKSCEELTGIPFGSHYSASYNETSLTGSTHSHDKDEDAMESYEETSTSSQSYLSTSYIDTHMDGAGSEDQQVQCQSQGLGGIIECGVTSDVSRQRQMPLTSVGNKLSDTMVEYEGQLLGMLAMLENCMEEAEMDFQPQGWATDASQEYVHINKNTHLRRGTTLVPIQQVRPMTMETQAMQLDPWAGEDEASKESRNEVTIGPTTNGGQQNHMLTCDMSSFSMESQGDLRTDKLVLGPQFRFSDPSMPLNDAVNDPMCQEASEAGYVSTNEGTNMNRDTHEIQEGETDLPAVEGQEKMSETSDLESGVNDLEAVGTQMEECIKEVQQLQQRRRELLAEVLELRGIQTRQDAEESNEAEESIDGKVTELMNVLKKEEEGRREERKKEVQGLREERAEEERRMWKVNLERQGLQEELRKLKRRLFAMARECAHSQVALNTQHREVELLRREEEKLQSLMLQFTEEGSQLRAAQQQQILDVQVALDAQNSCKTSSSQDELTECKRHSCGDIQQYLQCGLKALEDRYEPILLALVKRRDVTAEALVKAKEQAQELRTQLRPLKEEIQKLKLQRACLEEKLKLIHLQRREDVGQYKETVYCLEERSRELKTELKFQKRKAKEIEELRDSLTKQLLLYRAAVEDHSKCDEEKT